MRLREQFGRSLQLRQAYPNLAQVRVELTFADGTARAPSFQSFSYFPSARSFFRYACPYHSCSGEFDLSSDVAALAGDGDPAERSRVLDVCCSGQRARDVDDFIPCPIGAHIRVSAIPRPLE